MLTKSILLPGSIWPVLCTKSKVCQFHTSLLETINTPSGGFNILLLIFLIMLKGALSMVFPHLVVLPSEALFFRKHGTHVS